jgi:hypothetical protein
MGVMLKSTAKQMHYVTITWWIQYRVGLPNTQASSNQGPCQISQHFLPQEIHSVNLLFSHISLWTITWLNLSLVWISHYVTSITAEKLGCCQTLGNQDTTVKWQFMLYERLLRTSHLIQSACLWRHWTASFIYSSIIHLKTASRIKLGTQWSSIRTMNYV